MKPTPILVVEYLSDWHTANTLYCLGRNKQLELHYLSRVPHSSYRLLPRIKSFSYFPKDQPDESFIEYIKKVAHQTKAKVLVPTSSLSFTFVIQQKQALQQFVETIPVPEAWAYETTADKGLFAAFLIKHDIPAPHTLFDLSDNLEGQLNGFPFPVLLKPRVGTGGLGASGEPPITHFSDKETLLSFIKEHNLASKYIIQSFVDGYEIDCNVLYHKGQLIAYTIQKALIKTGPYAPSPGIEFIDNQEAIAIVDKLMSKLNWSGVAHIDMIYNRKTQELQIIEINPRFWQTMVGSLASAATNFPVLACRLALNQALDHSPSKLGKYITLTHFIKHKMAGAAAEKIKFRWEEIDMRYSFTMLPVRIDRFMKKT